MQLVTAKRNRRREAPVPFQVKLLGTNHLKSSEDRKVKPVMSPRGATCCARAASGHAAAAPPTRGMKVSCASQQKQGRQRRLWVKSAGSGPIRQPSGLPAIADIPLRCRKRRSAGSFPGGFRTTAPVPAASSRWAVIRNPSQGPTSDGYSIRSSAKERSAGEMSKPSTMAVFRLMTSSYLVGYWTGSSAGFAPLRMRST